MRTGIFLPQIGPASGPDAIVRAAQRAEALGYDGVWVTDRLLYPLQPQTPYPGTPDGSLPVVYRRVFDPVGTLAFVAAHTRRVGLGTSVLDMPFYSPVVLARQLTTLDVLSGGRLRVAFGQGWSKDEYDAVGISPKGLGRRADEFIQVLTTIWTTDPVEFHGRFFHVPRSIIQPKPVQKPHPPLYLAGYVPSALRRAATFASAWHVVGVPLDGMRQMSEALRTMARDAGRDPATVEVVVRANLVITETPLGSDRWIFTGTLDQIRQDIAAVRQMGAAELIVDPTFSPGIDSEREFVAAMETVRRLV